MEGNRSLGLIPDDDDDDDDDDGDDGMIFKNSCLFCI
jgi:hypothetical protein